MNDLGAVPHGVDEGLATLFAAIRAKGPDIASRSLEIEATRRLPADLAQWMRDIGVPGLPVPALYGGSECRAEDMVRVIEEMSYFDGSVGWCAMIYLTSGTMAGLFPHDWAKQIFGSGEIPLIGGATAPTGRGRLVDGGAQVTGRWAWGSGTDHADWIGGGTLLSEGGEGDRLKTGEPRVHLMMFSRDQVHLHDNWDPSGLCGTGSVDFEVTDAFVPEGRWIVLGATPPAADGPLYRFPFFGLFASCVSAVAIGIARRAIDEFVILARDKVPAWQKKTIAANPVTKATLARSEATSSSSRAFLYESIAGAWDKVAAGGQPTFEDRRLLRLAAAYAAECSANAVDGLYTAGGGSSVHRDNPLQRCFRDVRMVTQHRMASPANYELAGSYKLEESSAVTMF